MSQLLVGNPAEDLVLLLQRSPSILGVFLPGVMGCRQKASEHFSAPWMRYSIPAQSPGRRELGVTEPLVSEKGSSACDDVTLPTHSFSTRVTPKKIPGVLVFGRWD